MLGQERSVTLFSLSPSPSPFSHTPVVPPVSPSAFPLLYFQDQVFLLPFLRSISSPLLHTHITSLSLINNNSLNRYLTCSLDLYSSPSSTCLSLSLRSPLPTSRPARTASLPDPEAHRGSEDAVVAAANSSQHDLLRSPPSLSHQPPLATTMRRKLVPLRAS